MTTDGDDDRLDSPAKSIGTSPELGVLTETWSRDVLDIPVSETVAASTVMQAFLETVRRGQLRSTVVFDPLEKTGSGGEGYVFRAVRRGADGFSAVSAVKLYSPAIYHSIEEYRENMRRISRIASTIARTQHDHLVGILNFSRQKSIRYMVMEWIDGFDLATLMFLMNHERFRGGMRSSALDAQSGIVVAANGDVFRFTPGVTIHLIRECLSGLAALHRVGLVHGDVKPSNIMLDRNGSTKLIDIGSACRFGQTKPARTLTPLFAAPEVLTGASPTPQSDLASLGYTMITMLTGRVAFRAVPAKHFAIRNRWLPDNLHSVLPDAVRRCESIVSLCKDLTAFDVTERLESAQHAIRRCDDVQRQLVLASLDCDYQNFICRWMDQMLGGQSPIDVAAALRLDRGSV